MKKIVLLLFLGTFNAAVFAAPSALSDLNAQEILRRQEIERIQREALEDTPSVHLDVPELSLGTDKIPSEELCFQVNEISLSGDLSEKFLWALDAANTYDDPYVNRCLGTEGLKLVMRRIQNAVISKGYVTTRIMASKDQDLKSGVFNLIVIPGMVRQVRFSADSDLDVFLQTTVPIREGNILNLRDIEQGLENLKRVPSSEANIEIEATEIAGQSDIVVTYKRSFPVRMSVSFDDAGSKATGRYQGNVSLSFDSLLGMNDMFYISGGHDVFNSGRRGSANHSIYYSVPFGYWSTSISSGYNTYHQNIAGLNQDYSYSGSSRYSDFTVSRLVYRDAVRKLSFSGSLWVQESKNFLNDTEIEVQRRKTAGWKLGVNYTQYIQAATVDFSLSYRRGTGALDSLTAPEEYYDEGTSRMKMFLLNAQYSQPFKVKSLNFRYSGAFRGQWNETPLTPIDRFSIGSRYSVRGFDGEYTLSSDRGFVIRNDLGVAIPPLYSEFYLALDYGKVTGQYSQYLIGNELLGTAAGFRGAVTKHFTYDVFVGTPLYKPSGMQAKKTVAGFNTYITF